MKRTKHTLITAEILGFFLIIIALLGIITGRRVFVVAGFTLFLFIVVVTGLFIGFLVVAVKGKPKKKRK